MIGQTISNYKILEKLGEGGMGEVYLAEDTELNRKIALKFLPLQYTKDVELNTRFKREARTAAALNHPNIITIHEVGEFEGKAFIAMEYVAGDSLRDRMGNQGLSTEQVLDYAVQICGGLSKAHEAGIIHRDLKPENIMVDKDGRIRILDFGLAKFTEGTKLTRHSSTLGTLTYMSPEQFESSDVDQRTDIWSLGVMLYEMLTGHTPFEGDYEAAVMYSIMNESPEPVSTKAKKIPAGLDGVVNRALAKRREDRYPATEELLEALKVILGHGSTGALVFRSSWRLKRFLKQPVRWLALAIFLAAVGLLLFRDQFFMPRPLRIAVLPFQVEGLDQEDQAKIGGLWNQTLDDFLKLDGIRPLTRSIAARYQSWDYDPEEFRNRFEQDVVLQTSVQKTGADFRLTTYITDLKDLSEVWRGEFTTELLGFRESYAPQIYAALGLSMKAPEMLVVQEAPTQSSDAYAFYLQAQNAITRFDLEGALKLFDRAIELDPNFASAYAGRAFVYGITLDAGLTNDRSVIEKAEHEVSKALAANPSSAEAQAHLGYAYMFKGRIRDSYGQARKALRLEPNNLTAKDLLINVYFSLGLLKKAETVGREILARDPLNASAMMKVGNMLCQQGKIEEGIRFYEKSLELYPGHIHLLKNHAWANILLGRFDIARTSLEKAKSFYPNNLFLKLVEALLFASERKPEQARQLLTTEVIQYAEFDAVRAWWTKKIYAQLNDADSALFWLKRQISFGFENYPELLKDPLIEPIRSDPRFQEIMLNLEKNWRGYQKEFK